MKLCLIANPNSIHTRRWINFFLERNYAVHLIGDKPLQVTLPNAVNYYDLTSYTNQRKFRYLVWGGVVRRLVHKIQPDVLHAQQVTSAGWLGLAAGYHPFIVSGWGSDLLIAPRVSRVQRQLARWVLKRADYVTCLAQTLVNAAVELGADPAKIEVAPWGIDTTIYRPLATEERALLRQQYNIPLDAPVVISIRALQDTYNPLDIAHAIPQVATQLPTAHFVVLTYRQDDQLFAQFLQILQAHCVNNTVHFVGDLPSEQDVANICSAADVAVSVSSSDGTPSSVMEAIACGAVPVLGDIPSLREWIQHEQQALYTPLHDIESLSQTIIRLLTDPHLRTQLRAKGQELVRAKADRSACMARNEQIYREVIERYRHE